MTNFNSIHQAIVSLPYQIGAVITGGGAGAMTELLKLGGMSAVLEEFSVPYGMAANEEFMRYVYLPSHCSKGAAILLAAAQAARLLRMRVDNPMAVACTASLATPGQRDGRTNQAWICIATDEGVWVNDIQFSHAQSRQHQEDTLEINLLHWMADHHSLPLFFLGELKDFVRYYTPLEANVTSPKEQGPMVFSGSFNPWHKGHESTLILANKRFPKRQNVIIEVGAVNADKGLITPDDIKSRMDSIPSHSVIDDTGYPINIRHRVGTAPTFSEKAEVYSNPLFVVGSDTMYRIGDPKYLGHKHDAAMEKLAKSAEFFVMLRGHTEVEVKKNIPAALYDKCVFAEHEFAHISSTEIRNNG